MSAQRLCLIFTKWKNEVHEREQKLTDMNHHISRSSKSNTNIVPCLSKWQNRADFCKILYQCVDLGQKGPNGAHFGLLLGVFFNFQTRILYRVITSSTFIIFLARILPPKIRYNILQEFVHFQNSQKPDPDTCV